MSSLLGHFIEPAVLGGRLLDSANEIVLSSPRNRLYCFAINARRYMLREDLLMSVKRITTFFVFVLAAFLECIRPIRALADTGMFVQDTVLSPSNPIVIDFSLQKSLPRLNSSAIQITYDPVAQDENIVLTTNARIDFNDEYSLNYNGGWGSGRNGYVGLDLVKDVTPPSIAQVEFQFLDGAVSAVGAFMNYGLTAIGGPPAGGDPTIATRDANGNTIDQFDVFQLAPIFTLFKADVGAFRGIVHKKNDIAAVRFSNAYLVLDDLTFGRMAVPEPSTAALLVIGCIVGLVIRRR